VTFHHACCEVCGRDVFRADDLIAYQVRAGRPARIDLGGKQPWAGVRCVCLACIEFLREGED
jgi:hypothetical protein